MMICLKRIASAALTAVILLCFPILSGCKKTETEEESKKYDYNLSEYITLGNYKGLTVEKADTTVTEEQLDAEIASVITSNTKSADVTERGAVAGDTMTIDYVGTIDGIPFDGGTATGKSFQLSEDAAIDGIPFGTLLAGAKTGDTVQLKITLPEDYEKSAVLAGREASFDVTVKGLTEIVVPELTDDFVKTISDCTTVSEYKAYLTKQLEEQNLEDAKTVRLNELWQKILEASSIIKYPETELNAYIEEMTSYYEQYAAYYGYKLEEYLSQSYGIDMQTFNADCLSYAQNAVKEEMVLYSLARTEKIELSNEEYAEGLEKYAALYGYDSAQALEEQYGHETLFNSILWDKVMEFVSEQAVEVELYADTAEAAE